MLISLLDPLKKNCEFFFFGDVQPATTTEGGEDGEGPAPEMSRGGYGGGGTPQIRV